MKERPIESFEGELPGDRMLRAFDALEGTVIGKVIENSLITLRDAVGGLRRFLGNSAKFY